MIQGPLSLGSSPAQLSPLPEDRRIEVHRVFTEDGSSHVLVQDMAYGPGVGWFAQKTICLDDRQVEALLKKLCCARHPGQRQGARTPCNPARPGNLSTGGPPSAPEPGEIIHLGSRLRGRESAGGNSGR